MDKRLELAIEQYQAAVKSLFPRVAAHLGVKLPISNTEWTGIDAEQRGTTSDNIQYFIHGYGIAMKDGEIKVDFDLGDQGQINGFDLWRLWGFIEDNNLKHIINSKEQLKALFEEAVAKNELIYSGYILYYLNI